MKMGILWRRERRFRLQWFYGSQANLEIVEPAFLCGAFEWTASQLPPNQYAIWWRVSSMVPACQQRGVQLPGTPKTTYTGGEYFGHLFLATLDQHAPPTIPRGREWFPYHGL